MAQDLVTYDSARRAIAEARTIVDVRDVRDKAEALRSYAKMAKDRDLELSAAEIRVRAERRLGEMLVEIKAAARLASGGRPVKTGSPSEPVFAGVTLEELGIDKKLSMRAQQYAAIPAPEFESRLAAWRDVESRRATRAVSSLFKAVARPPEAREHPPLPEGRYRVIYADPPWRFETWSDAGRDRGAENHYPTMPTPEICALPVGELAAPDCVLFLWATGPMLAHAFAVIEAWGFAYKTIGFTWAKLRDTSPQDPDWYEPYAGNGYWTRANAELCLLATRGAPHRREKATAINQVVLAPRARHSEKPEEVARRIEALVEGPYVELFARTARPGWDVWGDQAPEAGDG